MKHRANNLRRLHELSHGTSPGVVAQVEKAFRCILGEDPKLKHGLVLNQSAIECGRLSDIELIHHCMDKEVPLVVQTTAHEILKSKSFFFLNPSDRKQVIIYSLDGSGKSYKVPVETLRVDLDFEYMTVDPMKMK